MAKCPPDIADLERMLNDGECDDNLNSRAIEIFERLLDATKRAKRSSFNYSTQQDLTDETKEFERVLKEIEKHRHTHVLDRFKEYLRSQ